MEKRPRHYALEIIAMRTAKERRESLERVPVEYRDWVAYLVKQWKERKQ